MSDRTWNYGTVEDETEIRRWHEILGQCFLMPADARAAYRGRVGSQNYRAVRSQGKLAGGLARLDMGQWFGGRCVSMTGVQAVGIAPEYRGAGAAQFLMRSLLHELYDDDIALSSLYAAAPPLYRSLGYEATASRVVWEIPTADLAVGKPTLPVTPTTPDATNTVLAPLYRQFAQCHSGHLDRHSAVWGSLWQGLKSFAPTPYVYEIGDPPEGYLVFSQSGSDATLHLQDFIVLTPAALQSAWGFLHAHRSQLQRLRWYGGVIDGRSQCLPHNQGTPQSSLTLFSRIVRVENALTQRGYPPISATLHLEVRDDLLPQNGDRFVLTVEEGEPTVSRGGRGDLKVNVRHLSTLYSGYLSASVLQRWGNLSGEATAIATADRLFASDPPWLPDFF